MDEFIAKCGINCANCPSFEANLLTDEDRVSCSKGFEIYHGFRIAPEKLRACCGCQTPDDVSSERYLNCVVRRCAIKTGVENCAYCSAYPCEAVPTVTASVNTRAEIEAELGKPIPEEDYLVFIEPYEGLKHLDTIRLSIVPSEIVEKYEVKPLRAKIVNFPEGAFRIEDRAERYRSVHDLLERILLAQTDTYAQQLMFKRRKPHMLGLLWVVARYGEIGGEEGASLILDGGRYGSQKECSWLVRKRDNSFHGAVREAAEYLKSYGVPWEFETSNGGWFLVLSFDDDVGGLSALKALHVYVEKLVDGFGDAEYAGSTRFKGESFQRFSRADMQFLAV
ncbi:MAG: DUF3795 domain-containing protein [Anaerolineales bacterium]|nr:DUF3795 domain-containing protein [Anaerolineales bacterium]